MNGKYIWQDTDLHNITWQDSAFSSLLSEVNLLRGKLLGRLSLFGFKEQSDFMLNALTEETVHSSAIEGESLNSDSVRSSVAKQLGLEYEGLPKTDHYTEGVSTKPSTKKGYFAGIRLCFLRGIAVCAK